MTASLITNWRARRARRMPMSPTPLVPRWTLHTLGLAAAALVFGLLFLKAPGLGDDLTYWMIAFDVHEGGADAWPRDSFHALRWPLWGVCWLLQGALGSGLAAYSGTALLYLAAGSVVSFTFGRLLFRSTLGAWACGCAFFFHPLLDAVCAQPLPDLSEGVWEGCAMLAWWALMHARTRGVAALCAAGLGLAVFLAVSNRLTGAFIVPVLGLCTLFFFPRRFGWLLAVGSVAGVLYGLESLLFHRLTGDWLYSLHTNSKGKGFAGTEPVPLWFLPLRFWEVLWHGNPLLSPLSCVLALIGIWAGWTGRIGAAGPREALLGRVLVVWLVALYLEYACAPQSLSPWRPVVRAGERFLGSVAMPMSIVAVCGLAALGQFPWLERQRWLWGKVARVVALALLLAASLFSRGPAALAYLPEMRAYVRGLRSGTKVFTHPQMRALAHLADARSARRVVWLPPANMLYRTPEIEAALAQADELWYARRLLWMGTRKALERRLITTQRPLSSALADPAFGWALTRVLTIGGQPDLVFHRRRGADMPPPLVLGPDAPVLASLLPATLPAEQRIADLRRRTVKLRCAVPPSLRGRLCRLEIDAQSDWVNALTLRLRFTNPGQKHATEHLLDPCFFAQPARDVLPFPIPPDAEQCEIEVKFSKQAQVVRLNAVRLVLESAP